MTRLIALALLPLLLLACKEEVVEAPDPVTMSDDALSHFCQMNVAEHGGPKGQIHLEGYPYPIFFAQVRDLVAYLKSPERDARIPAIYASDMGVAPSWETPGIDNWIAADTAHFVVDAGVAGGMGAPEIVPFSSIEAAQDFIARYGGRTTPLQSIPDEAAIGAVDLTMVLEEPS